MSQTLLPTKPQMPARAAEGYSKEIFSEIDVSQLPEGVGQTGLQAAGVGGITYTGTGLGTLPASTQNTPQGVPITDVFMAILLELRQMNAILLAMQTQPCGGVNTNLMNQ